MLTDDIAAAIDGADYVAVVTPSTAHVVVATKLKGVIKKDQIIKDPFCCSHYKTHRLNLHIFTYCEAGKNSLPL